MARARKPERGHLRRRLPAITSAAISVCRSASRLLSAPRQRTRRVLRAAALCLLSAAALWGTLARAQGGGGGHSGGGPGGGHQGGGGFPGSRSGFPGNPPIFPGSHPDGYPGRGGVSQPSSRNPLQQGPGGRWWDNGKYAKSVGLTADQRGRMDNAFEENRAALTNGLDALRKAQERLDSVSNSDHPSEAALLTEIQNVAQARADLQKANAHLLLQIRNEMTAEQIGKLERLSR